MSMGDTHMISRYVGGRHREHDSERGKEERVLIRFA